MNDILAHLITLAGWLGALATVGAYALVTQRRISVGSVTYQGLNITGAALLAVSATVSSAWPSAVVNYVWVLIGAQALVGMRHAVRAAVARRLQAHAVRLPPVRLLPQRTDVTPEEISAAVVGAGRRRRRSAGQRGSAAGADTARATERLVGVAPLPHQFLR